MGSKNHYLYFLERTYQSGDATVLNRATLSSKSYAPDELATELQTQMRAVSLFGTSAYTVVYDAQTNTFAITLTYTHPDPLHATYPGFFVVNQDLLADEDFQAYAASRTQFGTLTPYSLNFRDPRTAWGSSASPAAPRGTRSGRSCRRRSGAVRPRCPGARWRRLWTCGTGMCCICTRTP